MAYSLRYGRNRRRFVRYNRRRGVPVRKFSRGRRRRAPNKRRSYRRLMNVTARKFRDTYYGTPNTDNPSQTQASLNVGTNVFAFCPTYRDLNLSLQNSRESAFAFAKGYRERITIRVSQPVLWRRIVFWSYDQFFSTYPFQVTDSNTGNDYYLRRLDHKSLYGAQSQLRQGLFRGTSGIDYTNSSLHNAVIDRQKNRVKYDRTINVTPNYDASTDEFGKIMERTHWHPCNSKIMYDDIEDGSSVIRSGWSSVARRSAGNMYIVDIISTGDSGMDASTQVGTVAMHGTYYWHER